MSFGGSQYDQNEAAAATSSRNLKSRNGNGALDFDGHSAADDEYISYEPNFLYKESATSQEQRIRASSRFGHL
mgnify:CR=1 FL=1